MRVSKRLHSKRQVEEKTPESTQRLRYGWHLVRHRLGDLCSKCLNQWKCSSWNLLLFKIAEAINHETQIQMEPALSALELLITKPQEKAFQGNDFSSRIKADRRRLSGLSGCLHTQTTRHLMTLCLSASSTEAVQAAPFREVAELMAKCWEQRSVSFSSS